MNPAAPARRAPAALPDPYRALFDSVSDMVVLIAREADGGYRCLKANEAVSRMEGIPLDAIVGKRVDAIHPPEVYAEWKAIYDRALEKREPLDVDHEVPSPLGPRQRRTRFLALPPDEEGRELLLGVCQDLTDSLKAKSEQADFARYRAAMNRFNALLDGDRPEEAMLQACVEAIRREFDVDRCLLTYPCDPAAHILTIPFYAQRPGAALTPFPKALPVSGDAIRAFLALFMESQEPVSLGPADLTTLGSDVLDRFRVRARLVMPIRPRSGQAWCLALYDSSPDREWSPAEKRLFQDMAARLRSALDALLLTRTLRRNEEFRNLLTEMMPQLLWTSDAQGKVDYVNRRLREFTGLDDLDRIGKGEHMHPADMEAERERLAECIRDCALFEAEMRLRRRDGAYVWHLVRSAPLLDAQGRVERRVGTCTDISDSKRLLEALARSKEELEAILSGIADAIVAQRPDGRLVYANEAAARQLGFPSAAALIAAADEAMTKGAPSLMEFFDEEGRPMPVGNIPSRLAREGASPPPAVLRFRIAPGAKERWVIAQAKPLFDREGKVALVLAMSQDITELKEKEEAVRRMQKMESLGKLAGGIAHDFNNLLVSINGYGDMGARETEGVDPLLHEYFTEILKSGERAAALTQQLLAYGRKQMVQPRVLDLNAVVGDMQKLLLPLIGEDIRLAMDLAPDTPPVLADAGQMEQVIMNLALNARDAMPQGGRLTLGTGPLEVGEAEAASHAGARAGSHAQLTVRDTGTGIDPAIRDRIFEPFFTTKSAGYGGRAGSGLGLASVYGIVDQWGGHIRLESEVGKGSTFRILLPAHREKPPADAAGPSGP